ncbi:hypothetical protein RRG08_042894 [Elysia crispata]|uniref:Uncharacterized protein n=1 Tax=Elysia crispata TaxID=231223 RepID=A0AAE1AUN0_9GAST|nr:hypothetical protein RRG08_042894 [Elysia crispata]
MPSNNRRDISSQKNSESEIQLLGRSYSNNSSSLSSGDSESKTLQISEENSDNTEDIVFCSESETSVKVLMQNSQSSSGYETVPMRPSHPFLRPFRSSVRSASTTVSSEENAKADRNSTLTEESPYCQPDLLNAKGSVNSQTLPTRSNRANIMDYLMPTELPQSSEHIVSPNHPRVLEPPKPHRLRLKLSPAPPSVPNQRRLPQPPNLFEQHNFRQPPNVFEEHNNRQLKNFFEQPNLPHRQIYSEPHCPQLLNLSAQSPDPNAPNLSQQRRHAHPPNLSQQRHDAHPPNFSQQRHEPHHHINSQKCHLLLPPSPPIHCCLQPTFLLLVTGFSVLVGASCLILYCASLGKWSTNEAHREICIPCLKLQQDFSEVTG